MAPTERPGETQMDAEARVLIELDQPDIIPGDRGGEIFTDAVLITYTRRAVNVGGDDEGESGWVAEARVSGNHVAKRRNRDGSPQQLNSFGKATFLQSRDVFPDWLSELTKKYDPESSR